MFLETRQGEMGFEIDVFISIAKMLNIWWFQRLKCKDLLLSASPMDFGSKKTKHKEDVLVVLLLFVHLICKMFGL